MIVAAVQTGSAAIMAAALTMLALNADTATSIFVRGMLSLYMDKLTFAIPYVIDLVMELLRSVVRLQLLTALGLIKTLVWDMLCRSVCANIIAFPLITLSIGLFEFFGCLFGFLMSFDSGFIVTAGTALYLAGWAMTGITALYNTGMLFAAGMVFYFAPGLCKEHFAYPTQKKEVKTK